MTTEMHCRTCGRHVHAGRFCADCGAQQSTRGLNGPDWLRISQFCAAPEEHVLLPSIVSTLLPRLSPAPRRTFRLGIFALGVLLVVLLLPRWQAPAIGVAVLGFPTLLATYLLTTRVLSTQPRRTWVTAIGTGALLGIAWAVLTGAWLAHRYGVGFGAGVAGGPNSASLGVPIGAVLLMVLPAVVVRAGVKSTAGVCTGLLVGVLGATAFGVSATVVRLAPQLATGVVAPHRPIEGLLIEAAIRGVVIPITSAAIGGIAGVALWFTRGTASRRRRAAWAAALLAAIALASGTALVDDSELGPLDQLLVQLAVTVVALYGLRLALHLALLHERRVPSGNPPADCPECQCSRPGGAFCWNCGIAEAAAPLGPGARWRPAVGFGAGLAAAAACTTVISLVVTKPVAIYACPPECGSPPIGTAVKVSPRFTAADGSFTVAYPADGSGFTVSKDTGEVVAQLTVGDGGTLRLFGEPARGRDARRVVQDVLAKAAPSATRAYAIPSALVGYQPGYGQVDDVYPISATGDYIRLRRVTVAAIKDDYALVAAAVGPFHQFGPDFGPGPPSAVNLQLGLLMDSYVNSFRWRGDPEY